MSCILCANPDSRLVFQDDRLTVIQCTSCGLVRQADPNSSLLKLDTKFSNIDDYYKTRDRVDEDAVIPFNTRRVEVTTDIRNELQRRLHANASVLDVGCGSGEFAASLSQMGMDVVGVEPNPSLAAHVTKHLGVHSIAAMYEADLFPPDTFDAITFIQVVEHLEDPIGTLSIAHQHLKPGGLLVIDVPSFNNPRILAYRLTGIKSLVYKDFIPPHTYYYTPKTLSQIVEKANFTNIKVVTGRYAVKFENRSGPLLIHLLRLIDRVANFLQIGGITLYATKP